MWDPEAETRQEEIRGEFGTIDTNVPGIQLTDMLPQPPKSWTSGRSSELCHHHDAGHSTGDQDLLHGLQLGPNRTRTLPVAGCGSIVAEQLGHQRRDLPAYVMIPRMVPGTGGADVGVSYKPFETGADPAQPGPFQGPKLYARGGPDGRSLGRPSRSSGKPRPRSPRTGQSRPHGGARSVRPEGVDCPAVRRPLDRRSIWMPNRPRSASVTG
jgi:hypothetical protein